MKTSTKTITILTTVSLSTALLFSSPVQAKGRKRQARPTPAQTGSRNRVRDSDHGLTLSIDLGSIFNSAPARRWVPGHYQVRTEQLLVEPGHYEWHKQRVLVEPGHYEIRTLPAAEKIRRDSRRKAQKVVVKPARTKKVWVPARYEMRKVKVYVPPRYETRRIRVWVPGHWVSQPVRSPARSWLNLGAIFNFRF
ncbi:MAG: hypothetical protein KAT11_03385 [Phycisphaerae bacterium]|nr:hypothetical protein [Phycisphaerae bacterium]